MPKKLILGFGLAIYLLYFATRVWLDQRIWLPARHGGGAWITGDGARSLAISTGGLALLCHARWFWGLRGDYQAFERLTILASLIIIGGILAMLWFVFGW